MDEVLAFFVGVLVGVLGSWLMVEAEIRRIAKRPPPDGGEQ